MKIYTVTTQFANNMGALLQCYALSAYLNNEEHVDCTVLNYLPKDHHVSWSYCPKPTCFKDVLKNLLLMMPCKLYETYRKNKKVRRFINDYIVLSKKTYTRKTILNNPPCADAYICGSDQIWNFRLFNDHTYYLDFCDKIPGVKRISYAASITDYWNEAQIESIKPLLKRFDTLTLRDRSFVDSVAKISGRKVSFVADPVFLLSRDKWSKIANEEFCINEPYILCYFIGVPGMAVKAVENLRKKTGYKVIHLNVNARDRFQSDVNIRVADPLDFVGLIKNATYVCTNSFHCSSFSIIFRKNLLFLKDSRDERVESLKDIFNIPEIIMKQEDIETLKTADYSTDYSRGGDDGRSFIEFSKKVLHDSLWG